MNQLEQPPKVIVLQASAGSGKTYRLSIEFIRTILSNSDIYNLGNPFKHLLAITFTNKAACEMKDRILKHLKMLAIDKDDFKDREQLIKDLNIQSINNEDIRLKADKLVKKLLNHYSDFQVRTIDSFLRSIIAASIRETSFTPNFQISMNSNEYVEYAVDELFSNIQTDASVKEDFLDFLNVYFNIERKVNFYPKKDIIEIINNIRHLKNKKDKDIKIDNYSTENIRLKKEEFVKSFKKFLDKITENKIEVDKRIFNNLKDIFKKININNFSSSLWEKAKVGDFFKKEHANKKDPFQPLWDEVRRNLAELIKILSEARYKPYLSLLIKTEAIIKDITKASDEILIDDINNYVKSLIENQSVPELFFNLGEQILYYFIDEFQDTDRAQWSNIKPLVLNALANNGTLFYVGDKKQSIYRFKGSDAGLFDEIIEDHDIKVYKVAKYYLNENRRSSNELVNFLNETFEPQRLKSMLDNNNKSWCNTKIQELIDKTYKKYFQNSKLNNEDIQGYVSVEYIKSDTMHEDSSLQNSDADQEPTYEDIIVTRIEKIVSELINSGITFSDIAILTRTNKEAEIISEKLKKNNMPIQSERGFNIKEHPLIIEIISFLTFINNPADNLSFVTFVTGDIFTKSSGLTSDLIYKWLFEHRYEGFLYLSFKQWQPELWENLIKPLFNAVGYLPAYDIVNEFIKRFKLLNNFSESTGFFSHLIEMLKIKEDNGENNLDSFIKYWHTQKEDDDNFWVNLSSNNAIKLMTIHKAKGLEFPVVILPFKSTNKPKNMFVINKNNEITLSNMQSGDAKILYSIDRSDPYVEAYVDELALSFIDELNAFYVATTRAKYALYILLSEKENSFYNLFKEKLQNTGVYVSGKLPIYKQKVKQEISFATKGETLFHWQNHIFIHQPDMDTLKYYKEERRGNVLHKMLSNIQSIDENIKEKLTEQLDAVDKEWIKHQPKLVDNLIDIINSEKAKKWFNLEPETTIFTEKEVVNKHGELKRIDRLILTKNETIIIDYKTGGTSEMEKHKKQVKEYMEIVSQLYPRKLTKGYLVYIDHKRIEEVIL